ncbi:unnamed protein product (macronuclear) [Paramecium tetraurelia]|uniref:Peptide deformylase n=1 Tax=Paramecium tetraurelia TaxID=5888 RepID=A0CRA8_PARTE|nr:uncharacterized protein GSPATT00009640001 [Paramecium tetraurelia]CAK73325.1 unnamed protein product [Paramecium tetraurelia]|eukprot:XP_001440722.1 hypothetical protein (macronuclear) [Paramecium tetraurelia strain d4-2]
MANIIVFGDKLSNALFSKCIYYGAFNKRFYSKVNQMKLAAVDKRIRILAANQVGLEQNLFIMLPQSSKMIPSEYKVIINPKILKISNEVIENTEESISFPQFKAKVNRYKTIFVSYDDKKGKTVEEELKGLESIWYQQAIDQVMGIPCISWIASQGKVELKPEYQKQAELNPGFLKAFKEYVDVGQQQKYQERNLYSVNPQDEREDYALQGPTHQPHNYELYEKLLRNLENELFYTF